MSDSFDRVTAALADRYAIERELGAGGMATVYLAEDLRHQRKVAVKVLRPELVAVLGAERFLQEIRTTANLQHPHILPLFDSGEAGSFLYYVMPFIDGETLRDKLNRETQLGIDEAVKIATDVADALDYAHRHNVIHRDIKPENILLHDGRPVVADFGIALAVSAAAGGRMTETGLSLGTPHYMSPEQATAEKDLTNRSDIYSLGSVLYEMLTGEPPHTGGSAQAIIMKIVTEPADPVTRIRKSVPANVAAATAKALEKLAADRFDTARAFADALANPQFTTPATSTIPTVALARRNATALAGWVVAGGLAAVLAGVLVTGRGGGDTDTPTYVTLDLGVDDVDPAALVEISRDGRTFLVARRDGPGSPLYIRGIDEPEFHPLPGTENAVTAVFDPTGEWVVYRDRSDATLKKVALQGGRPIRVFTDGGINPFQPVWGVDGTIAFTGPDGLFVVPGNGGVPRRLSENGPRRLDVLPDGSGVLYTDSVRPPNVYLYDMRTDSVTALIGQAEGPTYLESGHILFAHPDGGLFVVPFDIDSRQVTGERVPVLDGVAGRFYAVSSTGTLVYRTGMSGVSIPERHLVRAFTDGVVDTIRLATRGLVHARISPDGRRLVFLDTGDEQLYLYDFELGGPTQLTFEGLNDSPVWSPDGSRIVFAADRGGSGGFDLYLKSVDTGDSAELFLSRPGAQFPESWSVDGTIVFHGRNTGRNVHTDLFMIPEDGVGEPAPFLVTEWSELSLAVSPDARWAAYQSDETGDPEVYVRAFPAGTGRRQVSTGGGFEPRWAPDGRTIYYARYGNGADSLMAARVQFEPAFRVTETEVVFTAPDFGLFDVHPDGTHVLVEVTATGASAGDTASRRSQVVVILNWFDELERILEGR